MATWQRLQKALRQRNSWLRHGTLDGASQAAWDRELCLASDEIDEFRRAYIKALKPVFEQTLSELVQLEGLTLSYYRGWDKEKDLSTVLASSLHRDQQIGHTQAGPQRADLRLRLGGHNAADILSRGQQKLVVCALRIAQGHSGQPGSPRPMYISRRRPAIGARRASPQRAMSPAGRITLPGIYHLCRS
jgi:DNA replication and repair protein RecF